jgi:hypothetical protein
MRIRPISADKTSRTTRLAKLSFWLVLLGSLLPGGGVFAQSHTPGGMPPPDGMSLAQSAAMRFPQPVRVGDLLQRNVLQPVATRNLLGTVEQVVRSADGTVDVVIRFGGFLGFGTRLIAVPVDAMVLLGQDMEVVAYTPDQLDALPTYSSGDAKPLPSDSLIKVGLAKPSH